MSYYAAKLLPFSLDTVILYMPAFVSSLVVIPIILLGRLYSMTAVGFLSALLASVTWSYYNRTMVGYYDTDMFSAMAPMFIVYFLLAANHKKSLNFALLAAFMIILYPFLYNQGRAMVFAISVLYISYVWLVHRKESFAYPAIAIVASAMLPLWWPFRLLAVFGVFGILKSGRLSEKQTFYMAVGLTLVYVAAGDGFNFIYHKIMRYADRENARQGLHFFNVVQTVREAGHIPFELLAKRISGSVPAFVLAVAGYMLLLWRKHAFVITLPLMGLGIFAWWGGLRFTVYAVPVAAIGIVYLFCIVGSYFGDRRLRYGLTTLMTAAALYPNISHVMGYKMFTVFNRDEVKILDRLRKLGTDKDYVITWWDYGYPIWYYADKNTLIDGAKHQNDNFIVSEILTSDSQAEAARLARIAVETYVGSGYQTVADTLFGNGKENQIDPNLYLENLKAADLVKLPRKSREIYLFLPWRMSAIFSTVRLFSNIDLTTGEIGKENFYHFLRLRGRRKDRLVFNADVSLDMKKGMLIFGNREVPLRRFVTTEILENGKVSVKTEKLDSNATLSMIHLRNYRQFLVVDEKMFNSLYIQLFFLRRYDPSFFEPVLSSPWAVVYRLKI